MLVYNEDASAFITRISDMESVFTSIPDPEEIGMKVETYPIWFVNLAANIMGQTLKTGYAIFYQTDRKSDGHLISKCDLLMQAAKVAGLNLVFHKICTTTHPGSPNLFRPGFSHLLCFSKQGKSGRATPDVIPAGKKIYKNATGKNACAAAFGFLKSKGVEKCFDLFCGAGSIAYVGMQYFDIEVVSVDIDSKQCEKTKQLLSTINPIPFK